MKKGYLAPGVYVEETSLLPKSIAQVETAIPAFIGFTKKAAFNGQDFHQTGKIQPLEVNSMTDYEKIFGSPPPPASLDAELDGNNQVKGIRVQQVNFLYNSVKLFFENGGSTCQIVSVGNYQAVGGSNTKQLLLLGLAALEKTDTPTLLLVPDAVLLSYEEAGEIFAAMISQSSKLKNRIAIIDLVNGDKEPVYPENPIEMFRSHLGLNALSYGAAYYPWIVTASALKTDRSTIINGTYFKDGKRIENLLELFKPETLEAINNPEVGSALKHSFNMPAARQLNNQNKMEVFAATLYENFRKFYNLKFDSHYNPANKSAAAIHAVFTEAGSDFHRLLNLFCSLIKTYNQQWNFVNFSDDFHPLKISSTSSEIVLRRKMVSRNVPSMLKLLRLKLEKVVSGFFHELEKLDEQIIAEVKQKDDAFRNIMEAFENNPVAIPPGGAVAGMFCRHDREFGVWKAPAGVSLAAVIRPAVVIDDKVQEILNTDVVEGKSVNAIRLFAGRGTLVWGARTLAGNDNEWRYISVRRFVIMVEQSVLEATSQFVFEPNEAGTWTKVKAVIENFLFNLWRQGAFPGVKTQDSFFVRIGLGYTMTPADIQNGVMNTEIGLAVVRPSEFIIIKIVHKLQNT